MIFIMILAVVQSIPVHAKPEFEKFMDAMVPCALWTAAVVYAANLLLPEVDTPKTAKPSFDIQNTITPETKKAMCDFAETTLKVAVTTDLPFIIAAKILK